jgi:hypothetical protein
LEGFCLEGFRFTRHSLGEGRLAQKYGAGILFFEIFCFEKKQKKFSVQRRFNGGL